LDSCLQLHAKQLSHKNNFGTSVTDCVDFSVYGTEQSVRELVEISQRALNKGSTKTYLSFDCSTEAVPRLQFLHRLLSSGRICGCTTRS